jgi:hypothetical protein
MLKFLTKETDSEMQVVDAEREKNKEAAGSSVIEFTEERNQHKRPFTIQSCIEKDKKIVERDFCQLTEVPKRSAMFPFRKTHNKPLEPENIIFESSFTRGSSFKSFGPIMPSPVKPKHK